MTTDSPEAIFRKCTALQRLLVGSRKTVVYTGAGISTAASIPDYRGPSGVWTLSKRGTKIRPCNPIDAEPTLSHRALLELYKRGFISHVLSQNCDGLHLRSGFPQSALSEVHGNMYIEVCPTCEPPRQFIRPYDVTQKTRFRMHRTGATCPHCANGLVDTIVHFGEVGRHPWPLNWAGVMSSLDGCDLVICIGSSLKILKKYSFLWFGDLPVKKRPKLVIINLEPTTKDKLARIRFRAKCDDVLSTLASLMNIPIPPYCRDCDPVLAPRRRNSKNNDTLMNSVTSCTCGFAFSVAASLVDVPSTGRNSPFSASQSNGSSPFSGSQSNSSSPPSERIAEASSDDSEGGRQPAILTAKVISFIPPPPLFRDREFDDLTTPPPPIPRMRIKLFRAKEETGDQEEALPGWWRQGVTLWKRKTVKRLGWKARKRRLKLVPAGA